MLAAGSSVQPRRGERAGSARTQRVEQRGAAAACRQAADGSGQPRSRPPARPARRRGVMASAGHAARGAPRVRARASPRCPRSCSTARRARRDPRTPASGSRARRRNGRGIAVAVRPRAVSSPAIAEPPMPPSARSEGWRERRLPGRRRPLRASAWLRCARAASGASAAMPPRVARAERRFESRRAHVRATCRVRATAPRAPRRRPRDPAPGSWA